MSFGTFKRGLRKFGTKYGKRAVIGLRKIKNTSERITIPLQKIGKALEIAGAVSGIAPISAFGAAIDSTARTVNVATHAASGIASGIQKIANK